MEQLTTTQEKTKDVNVVLEKYADILAEEQLIILPMLGHGMSPARISKITPGITPEKIRMWLHTSPEFRTALDEFRSVKQEYHAHMLNQAGLLAWNKVFMYLEEDYEDETRIKIQADIAKFVISQMGLKTNKQEIQHKIDPQLHVTEDSAGLIARKLKELQDNDAGTIDSEYRIIVDTENVNMAGMATARALDEFHGKEPDAEMQELETEIYVRHPNSTYGELTYNDNTKRWMCHMCGKWTADLVVHIRSEHKLSPARYRNMYGLPDDTKFFIEQPREATDQEIQEFNHSLEK